ncbi:hypothetical protein EIN_052760 [Entamoeba invadens IP1]|uniref:hypothetical protein n=1 Tax=Entamoeba invadens IP1 TaxID=370355 RepID=UPI0002C3FA48|nr:hypothetical protein EIN_052760 [Entamoeba invadens IP1]ELP93061.1 hypothetical protein EIN_052760 [Entamoeba invadens IP1]|eukprot:XP_004259832.1 hypothetical protein EIN_052760 [Entamoeba invadens IP1]
MNVSAQPTPTITKQHIEELMSQVSTELSDSLHMMTKTLKESPLQTPSNLEVSLAKTLNEKIDGLTQMLQTIPTIPQSPKVQLKPIPSIGTDQEIDAFVQLCLEQLTLMRVINQNIFDAYKKMQSIVAKRESCEKMMQSYINSTQSMQNWLSKQ